LRIKPGELKQCNYVIFKPQLSIPKYESKALCMMKTGDSEANQFYLYLQIKQTHHR
jgi:hypothetical protein